MGKKSFWLIFFASLFIRFTVSDQSFWLDEGASIVLARLPLGGLFKALRGDFHPPLFYLLLHSWLPLAQHSEWLIRLPFIILGSLTVPVLYLLLSELLGKGKRKIALAATLLLMINPLHIYYSIELRMYSLNALLSLLSWLFLFRALRDKSKNPSPWRLFTLISLLNFYTFYGALFNLASQWVFVLWQHQKKIKAFAMHNLLVALLFLPWMSHLKSQLAGGGYLAKILPGWSELSGNLSIKSLGLVMAKFTIGRITLVNKGIYAIFVAGISIYFLLCSYLASLSKAGKALLVWFYVSLAAAILISLRAPVLGYWRYLFLVPPFVSIIALGLSVLPLNVFKFNLFVVSTVFVLGNLIFWVTPVFQREDWRSAAQLISRDRSLTIVNFPDIFAPLKFYAPDVYYYPDQESLGKTRPDLDQSLPLVIKGRDTVFVFDYLSDLTDKNRSILTWLKRAGLKQQPTHNINGVGFVYEFSPP